jgi:phosphinothricin acetyltransferase
MIIRDAVEKDLPAIVAIYNSTIDNRLATADTQPVSLASRQIWFEEHSSDRRPIWVMESNNIIIGWLSFQSFYGRPAYQATAELSIYVSGEYRRQGVGKKLLAKAIERSPELKIDTLLGFIFARNQPSLELFRQYQFQQWGYLPKVAELDGIKRDLVIVGRSL